MGRDGYSGLVVLAASLALFAATFGLERHPLVPVGPEFYPRIVLGVSAAFAVLLIVADALARRRAIAAPPPQARSNYALVLAAFGIFAGYVVALPYLGFRLATLVFLLALPVVLERPPDKRRWIVVVVVALAATIATYY
ncbi:MAG: tripartite tricarboxylate transporter TctB family protein, partial [Pseudomonadota bacterium]